MTTPEQLYENFDGTARKDPHSSTLNEDGTATKVILNLGDRAKTILVNDNTQTIKILNKLVEINSGPNFKNLTEDEKISSGYGVHVAATVDTNRGFTASQIDVQNEDGSVSAELQKLYDIAVTGGFVGAETDINLRLGSQSTDSEPPFAEILVDGIWSTDILRIEGELARQLISSSTPNRAPTLAAGAISATEDGEEVSLDLAALGDDPDSDDDGSTLIYAVTAAPSEGAAAISGTTLTFDPGEDFQDLAVGETRDVTIGVTATDQHGASAVNTVTVTVTGTNDAPTLAAGALAAQEDGAPVQLDLAALGDDADSDDDGSTLTYAVNAAPSEGAATIAGTTLSFDPGPDFQDLNDGESRDVIVQVTATDRHGASTTNNLTVTVAGNNDAPSRFLVFEDATRTNQVGAFQTFAEADTFATSGNAILIDEPAEVGDIGDQTITTDNLTIFANDPFNAVFTLAPSAPNLSLRGTTTATVIADDGGSSIGARTIGAGNILQGGTGDDFLGAGSGNDQIFGGDGNDIIGAGLGVDFIDGGAGNDELNLTGADDGDFVDGGDGTDGLEYSDIFGDFDATIVVNATNPGDINTITAGGQSVTVTNVEVIAISARGGADDVTGGAFREILRGGDGDDVLRGEAGDDRVDGDADNDVLVGGAGTDEILGGEGIDVVDYSQETGGVGVTVDLSLGTATDTFGDADFLTELENVIGTAQRDTLTGDDGDNILEGRAFSDTLVGGAGNDTLLGGDGSDVLGGGLGDDILDGGAGLGDRASYASATAGVMVDLSTGTANGGDGNDILIDIEYVSGSNFTDQINGDAGDNRLSGRAGDDVIIAGDGFDWLQGNAGDDILDGGAGPDRVNYQFAGGSVVVDLSAGTASGADGNDTLISIEQAIGSNSDDTLKAIETGDVSGNSGLFGIGGNDVLIGGAGIDHLDGGDGDDTLTGGAGTDGLNGGAGADTVDYSQETGGAGVDINLSLQSATDSFGDTDGLTSIENIIGTDQRDIIVGDTTNNLFIGGNGDDRLIGEAGDDVLIGGDGRDELLGDGAFGTSRTIGVDSLDGGAGDDLLSLVGIDQGDSVDGGADFDRFILYGINTGQIITIGDDLSSVTMDGAVAQVTNIEWFDLFAGTGDDTITGGDGAETLRGGDGNDVISGGGGNDQIVGDGGDSNQLLGGDGNDRLVFSGINDIIDGGAGAFDSLVYRASSVTGSSVTVGGNYEFVVDDGVTYGSITNVEGANLVGDIGADTLTGGTGSDLLQGLDGDDTLIGGDGNDQFLADAGIDTIDYSQESGSGGVSVDLAAGVATDSFGATDTFSDVENVTGSSQQDLLIGDAGANVLVGGDGDDTLVGGDSADNFFGGDGVDTVDYSQESGGAGIDVSLNALTGTDTFGTTDTYSSIERVIGTDFNDIIRGSVAANDEILEGGAGNDEVSGRAGNDIVRGGDGDDLVSGFSGVDQVFGDAGNDTLVLVDADVGDLADGGDGIDKLRFTEFGTSSSVIEIAEDSLTVNGVAIQLVSVEQVEVRADAGDDTVIGSAAGDVIRGGTGADIIDGAGGADRMTGNEGDDVFIFASGHGQDVITDLVAGAGTEDRIDLSSLGFSSIADVQAAASATGTTGADTLIDTDGAAGSDQIILLGVTPGELHADDFVFAPAPVTTDFDVVAARGFSSLPDTLDNFIFNNDGAGVLTDTGQSLGASPSRGVALFDLENDGDLDVVFADALSGGQASIYVNDGLGNFTADQTLTFTSSGVEVVAGDVNGDGFDDLVVGRGGASALRFLNQGDGTFDAGTVLGTSNTNVAKLADFDGDGDLDLLNGAASRVRVLENDGAGGFTSRRTSPIRVSPSISPWPILIATAISISIRQTPIMAVISSG